LVEKLAPLLPGSEQFKLQQSRAIDTAGTLLLERAFLQQSGKLFSGQEPSPGCAPIPTAPPIIAAMRIQVVNNFRMVVRDYIEHVPRVSSAALLSSLNSSFM